MARSASGDGVMTTRGGSIGADGAFTLTNVPPGDHYIDVVTQTRTPDAPPETASVQVLVSEPGHHRACASPRRARATCRASSCSKANRLAPASSAG